MARWTSAVQDFPFSGLRNLVCRQSLVLLGPEICSSQGLIVSFNGNTHE
jgi:hypothetical protein